MPTMAPCLMQPANEQYMYMFYLLAMFNSIGVSFAGLFARFPNRRSIQLRPGAHYYKNHSAAMFVMCVELLPIILMV